MAENPPRAATVVRLPRYTRADRAEILGAGEDPFGVASTGLTWQPKKEHFGVRHGDRLVAHAGLPRLPVAIDGGSAGSGSAGSGSAGSGSGEGGSAGGEPAEGERTEVVGVGGVAVAPDVRGQGLARRVVAAALDHARTLGPRHALLFCRPPLVPLYRHLGWRQLDVDVRVEQPGSRLVTMPLRTMVTPLRDRAHWPSGPVRVLSLPM